ncbi:MAG: phosphate acyltransferase PlsX [bacterium]
MSSTRPIIAVDAMGGDHGPGTVVPGAVAALEQDSPFGIAFYGDQGAIEAELAKLSCGDRPITVVHCTQDIAMGEAPAGAIRSRKDSPIVRAMTDHKAGRVQAVVSAGSTGAMVAASLIILGRLPGIDRPAIATLIPTLKGDCLLLDAGANLQCSPSHLLSFAEMGTVFAQVILGVENPSVGQLNIGGEPGKGTELCIEVHERLSSSILNFTGNVEGNQIMLGTCDVIVTDGFTGNNTLKLLEGFAHFLSGMARRPDLPPDLAQSLGPILKFMRHHFSYEVYGGAMLLGVAGISIIAHGRSSAWAITNAVKVGWRQVQTDLPAKLAAAAV